MLRLNWSHFPEAMRNITARNLSKLTLKTWKCLDSLVIQKRFSRGLVWRSSLSLDERGRVFTWKFIKLTLIQYLVLYILFQVFLNTELTLSRSGPNSRKLPDLTAALMTCLSVIFDIVACCLCVCVHNVFLYVYIMYWCIFVMSTVFLWCSIAFCK